MTNHNRGPIGPLDANEPPPLDPGLRRDEEVDAANAVLALRSMGVEITERHLDYWRAEGAGPAYREATGKKFYAWGDILDWAGRRLPVGKLNRKEATEYIRSLGYPIGTTVLSQLLYAKGPRFVRRGRDCYYAPEDLDEWVKERKARAPHHSTIPKYKPRYAQRRCPDHYEDCPNVRHEKCAKYARALCHFTHLPDRPGRGDGK
jgi:hypothetical protein